MDMNKIIPPNLPNPEYIVDFSKDPFGELTINIYYIILYYIMLFYLI